MPRPTQFARSANGFFAVALCLLLSGQVIAQRPATKRSPGTKPSSISSHATKPFSQRSNATRNSVSVASATKQAEALAPTAMGTAAMGTTAMGTANESLFTQEAMEGGPAQVAPESFAGCDSCGGQDACCCESSCFLLDWTRADLWIGTASFGTPANFLNTSPNSTGAIEGSFGFQEGINFGTRVPSVLCGQLGSQLGLRFIHSQLEGSAAGTDHRQQLFLTTGLFRRVDYGVQGGLVIDYLHEDWIYKADLLQLRGELSYLLSPCHELGFRFTDNQQTDDTTYRIRGNAATLSARVTALDSYRGFYRFRFSEEARGQAELQVGWTRDSAAILGIAINAPLQNQIGLAATTTYLLPQNDATPSYASEGWNLGLALVWTPGRRFGRTRDYYRPLFEVADNGSLISKLD